MKLSRQGQKILVVDDESHILSSIRDILEDEFEVLTEGSGEAALETLRRETVSVILCDQRMPGISGDGFFEKAKVISEATRILITGYADLDALVRAVNNGQIYAYIAKPWDPLGLKLAVQRAGDHYHLVRALNYERQALRESEEKLRLLLNSAAEAIFGMDLQGNCTFCNAACLRMLGYNHAGQLLGQNMHALVHHTKADGSPYPREECRIDQVFQGGEIHVEDEVLWRADGSSFPAEYWSYPIQREGETIGAVVTFLDVSEKKQLEEQLRQSQKMEAVGRLAGGVAHDFNNLLTGIAGFTQLVLSEIEKGSQLEKDLREVQQLVDRAAGLTRQLLAFSRRQAVETRVLNINPLIENMSRMLERLLGEQIELRFIPASDLGNIRGDAGQIEQVLVNLAVNAADAMPEGGRLTIETANVELEGEYSRTHFGVEEGSYVVLTISDTGHGMDRQTKEHIFEPFFTTKTEGKGTGLGLSVVYGIVEQHNGHIWVYSELGKGTIFKIYFPRIDTPIAESRISKKRDELPQGSETVLLAEDEEAVRNLVERILGALGYKVFSAADFAEAERMFSRHEREIDLLLTDFIMPGGTGQMLYQRFKQKRPDLKVLCMSGYTDRSLVSEAQGGEEMPFVQKPFTPGTLARKIREVLEGPRE